MGYETCVTTKGWELLGELIAAASGPGEMPMLQFLRVKYGKGILPAGVDPKDLDDVLVHVADGTSTKPIVEVIRRPDGSAEKCVISMVVEYASGKRMPEGFISPADITEPFYLSEFTVMTSDTQGKEIAFLRGDLVDCAMLITPFSQGALDVRQFQIEVIITDELEVSISFRPLAWLTAEDMYEYDEKVIQKKVDAKIIREIYEVHDPDEEAHEPLRRRIVSLEGLVADLLKMFNGQGSASFFFDFGSLAGLKLMQGVWNVAEKRIEY